MLKISLLTVEDYANFCAGLRSVLQTAGELVEVAEKASLSDTLDLVQSLRPDLVFLEVSQEPDDDFPLSIGRFAPEIQTQVVLVTRPRPEPNLGVSPESEPGSETKGPVRTDSLREACNYAAARVGEASVGLAPGSVREAHPESVQSLTPREEEILRLVGEGERDAQIARRLSISRSTVQTYICSLMRKFNIGDRLALPLYAFLVERRPL